jgi:hypothetical protein
MGRYLGSWWVGSLINWLRSGILKPNMKGKEIGVFATMGELGGYGPHEEGIGWEVVVPIPRIGDGGLESKELEL